MQLLLRNDSFLIFTQSVWILCHRKTYAFLNVICIFVQCTSTNLLHICIISHFTTFHLKCWPSRWKYTHFLRMKRCTVCVLGFHRIAPFLSACFIVDSVRVTNIHRLYLLFQQTDFNFGLLSELQHSFRLSLSLALSPTGLANTDYSIAVFCTTRGHQSENGTAKLFICTHTNFGQ